MSTDLMSRRTARGAMRAEVAESWQRSAAAGVTSSLGQVTDEYLADRFKWRYLNAPFYVVAIAIVLYVVSGFFLNVNGVAGTPGVRAFSAADLAVGLTVGTLLGVFSTLAFAIAESRFPTSVEPTRG